MTSKRPRGSAFNEDESSFKRRKLNRSSNSLIHSELQSARNVEQSNGMKSLQHCVNQLDKLKNEIIKTQRKLQREKNVHIDTDLFCAAAFQTHLAILQSTVNENEELMQRNAKLLNDKLQCQKALKSSIEYRLDGIHSLDEVGLDRLESDLKNGLKTVKEERVSRHDLCVMCMENPATCQVMSGCEHLWVCEDCSYECIMGDGQCPKCRGRSSKN